MSCTACTARWRVYAKLSICVHWHGRVGATVSARAIVVVLECAPRRTRVEFIIQLLSVRQRMRVLCASCFGL